MKSGNKSPRFVARAFVLATLATAPVLAQETLSLNVVGGTTFAPGETVTVTLDVSGLTTPINSVQALIDYDATLFTYVSVTQATTATNGSTVNWTFGQLDNLPAGQMTYVASLLGGSTTTSHAIATFTFTAIAESTPTTSFTFRADGAVVKTKLVKTDNSPIFPGKNDSAVITLTCDDGNECTTDTVVSQACVNTNNTIPCDDAQFCTENDVCSGGACSGTPFIPPSCVDGNGCTDDLCDSLANAGLGACNNPNNTAACDDANACTENDVCTGGVCAGTDPAPRITVDLQVDALNGMTAPLARDVMVDITTCPATLDARIVSVTFDNVTTTGQAVLDNVDLFANWISFKTGHSLSSLTAISLDACGNQTIDLTGVNSLVSGDWSSAPLSGGVAIQDDLVDVIDFSILATAWNAPIDPTLSAGADADGDGQQSTADFPVLAANFLKQSDPVDSCGAAMAGGGLRPISGSVPYRPLISVPVEQLDLVNADWVDLDGNGIVDVDDIVVFADEWGLELPPSFPRDARSQKPARRIRREAPDDR